MLTNIYVLLSTYSEESVTRSRSCTPLSHTYHALRLRAMLNIRRVGYYSLLNRHFTVLQMSCAHRDVKLTATFRATSVLSTWPEQYTCKHRGRAWTYAFSAAATASLFVPVRAETNERVCVLGSCSQKRVHGVCITRTGAVSIQRVCLRLLALKWSPTPITGDHSK